MENASKVLLIAAGVAIGVLLLSLIVIISTIFGELGRGYNERIELKYIQTFNSQFTKFNRTDEELSKGKALKAQDIMTIANLVVEWNNTGTNETLVVKLNNNPIIRKNEKSGNYEIVDNYKPENFLKNNNDTIENSHQIPTYKISKLSTDEDLGFDNPVGRIREIDIASYQYDNI